MPQSYPRNCGPECQRWLWCQSKNGKDKYALVSGEDAVGDDEHLEGAWVGSFREGETADGKSDEVGNCHGHGEQEQGVGLAEE